MQLWLTAIIGDPLLLKEIRIRMRARTVLIVENLYVIAICMTVLLSFVLAGNLREVLGWELGKSVFQTMIYAQAFLMLFVSPLVTASAVTMEREEKTFDSLWATPVSPRRIIGAKLAAALSCFLMLVLVSLPLISICFILGGVGPEDILKAYALTILCVVAAGAMGLYWSTVFQRSIASIPASAICVVVVVVFAPMLAHMNLTSVALISPTVFLNGLYEDLEIVFFGMPCPFWIPSATFLLLIFAYLVLAATIRLHFPTERRYFLSRLLSFFLFVCLCAFVMGEKAVPCEQPAEARRCLARVSGTLLAMLSLFAIWIGANMAVSRSEGNRGREKKFSAANIVRSLFVSGPAFVCLLILGAAPFVAGTIKVVGPLKIPILVVWAAYFGVIGLSVVSWTLLSARLADGKTAKRRFIGMAVSYLIAAVIVVASPVISGVINTKKGNIPACIQYVTLISPAPSIQQLSDPLWFTEQCPAAARVLGNYAPIWVTACIYVALTGVLTLAGCVKKRTTAGITTTLSRLH